LTAEQHNKYLSWAHFAHAAITALMMLFVLAFMTAAMTLDPNPAPAPFVVFLWVFFVAMTAVLTLPSIVAGYALLKRKRWAKIICIVAGVLASMSAPIGTAVCVYTFWFLFSEPGKMLYDNPQRMLSSSTKPWVTHSSPTRDAQYVPPPTPPDWR
jgi:TRAP-type uncharacterized transport system fused permease subunit